MHPQFFPRFHLFLLSISNHLRNPNPNFQSSKPYFSSPRAYRKRVNKRNKLSNKPILDETLFNLTLSKLPPRFSPLDLYSIIALQHDPFICLELFRHSSKNPRFHHSVDTFHITLQKLGQFGLIDEMYELVDQLLADPCLGSERLFNTVIYYFARARKLSRAITVFKHMKRVKNEFSKPSIKTYNILFDAFLSRGSDTYVNYVFMGTMISLFRQLLSDGIEPDVFVLNSMVRGYVLCNHVNDALRIFHQMGVVYVCVPNVVTYDCIVHGLCAQGRTRNARELFDRMKGKGFVPSDKTYNSLVNALALVGEVDEALGVLWEMIENRRRADFITYETLLDEMCRKGKMGQALSVLKEFEGKGLVDDLAYSKLFHVIKHDLHR